MNLLPPDLLSRATACVERAGEVLAAEFHRIPRPRGHGDTAGIDPEIELALRAVAGPPPAPISIA